MVRISPGCENSRILRHGYAVEYDMVWPTQIRPTLETKKVTGLFLAGQINGTSGYEEAAAQGLVAGVNAAKYAATQAAGGFAPFTLKRDEAYIGVLIDDLVTKPPIEPYRMFTSRAEHRLHLRNDNADERLTQVGRRLGLVDDVRWRAFEGMKQSLERAMALLESSRVESGIAAADWLRRPDADWAGLTQRVPAAANVARAIAERTEIHVKYEGYVARQGRQVE